MSSDESRWILTNMLHTQNNIFCALLYFPTEAGVIEKPKPAKDIHPILAKLKAANSYNPTSFDLNCRGARFYVIKSYSEEVSQSI